jgi:hypothetical protein
MRTKRTIEAHLSADQLFFQSLPPNATRNRAFVESCISQTIQLLSSTHGGHLLPHSAPDAAGSSSENLEGAQLSFFQS